MLLELSFVFFSFRCFWFCCGIYVNAEAIIMSENGNVSVNDYLRLKLARFMKKWTTKLSYYVTL